MNAAITRRRFVAMTSGGCLGLPFGLAGVAHANAEPDDVQSGETGGGLPPGFPSHDPELAREVVGKSHFDLETVTRLVEARPTLAKSAWDWGFGDVETALGAASHVGRRDIAEVLMAHGARADIFTLAMLGQLEAVKAIIAANPGIQRTHGPHGITLLAHARAGGEQASHVVEMLQALGDADQTATDLPIEPALRAAIIGNYVYELGGGVNARCAIVEQRSGLAFKQEPDGTPRALFHQGDGRFHPAGAPKVRIAFQSDEMTISDGAISLRAIRKG